MATQFRSRSIGIPLVIITLIGFAGLRQWANRVQEFRGLLKIPEVCIPEAPHGDGYLVASGKGYLLRLGGDRNLLATLQSLNNSQVVVQGVLRTSRNPFMNGRAYDWVQVTAIAPATASTNTTTNPTTPSRKRLPKP